MSACTLLAIASASAAPTTATSLVANPATAALRSLSRIARVHSSTARSPDASCWPAGSSLRSAPDCRATSTASGRCRSQPNRTARASAWSMSAAVPVTRSCSAFDANCCSTASTARSRVICSAATSAACSTARPATPGRPCAPPTASTNPYPMSPARMTAAAHWAPVSSSECTPAASRPVSTRPLASRRPLAGPPAGAPDRVVAASGYPVGSQMTTSAPGRTPASSSDSRARPPPVSAMRRKASWICCRLASAAACRLTIVSNVWLSTSSSGDVAGMTTIGKPARSASSTAAGGTSARYSSSLTPRPARPLPASCSISRQNSPLSRGSGYPVVSRNSSCLVHRTMFGTVITLSRRTGRSSPPAPAMIRAPRMASSASISRTVGASAVTWLPRRRRPGSETTVPRPPPGSPGGADRRVTADRPVAAPRPRRMGTGSARAAGRQRRRARILDQAAGPGQVRRAGLGVGVHVEQLHRVVADHLDHLLHRHPLLEDRLREDAQRLRRQRVVPLPGVGDEQAAGRPDPLHARRDLLWGGILPRRRHRAVAELRHGAQPGHLLQGVQVKVRHPEVGVGDDDLLHADRAGLAHERHDLPRGQVRGAEDRAVLGDQLQHLLDLGPELPVLVLHPDPLGLAPAALL